MPQHSPPIIMGVARDSNLRYLPLVYLLPEDVIAKCPTLRILPRKVREVVYFENTMKVVESDQFLKEIDDAVAALVFPHFGFGGWIEHYTGYFPVWQLAYALPVWARTVNDEIGWDLQYLFLVSSSTTIPFFNSDYIKDLFGRVVARAIEQECWQPVLDAVKEMPCDEDFMVWDTNVRTDFLRKWYHTRVKSVQMVSLESCIANKEHGIHEIEDTSSNFEENLIVEDFYQQFKARLSEKDMKILEFRVEGFTYEKIAERLGYKNHSGVKKRMDAIKQSFIEYENKYEQ